MQATLTSRRTPETSAIIGHEQTFRVIEVVAEIFACFERHASDSPYGMAQILYGDWCDPIDMFGTSIVGDARTRGCGRGVQSPCAAIHGAGAHAAHRAMATALIIWPATLPRRQGNAALVGP